MILQAKVSVLVPQLPGELLALVQLPTRLADAEAALAAERAKRQRLRAEKKAHQAVALQTTPGVALSRAMPPAKATAAPRSPSKGSEPEGLCLQAKRWLCLAAPSALTLGALACSLTAMRSAFAHNWAQAAGLIIAAAVCDGLDGHVARLLDAVTVFGGELDSLGDLVNFGVAPAIVMYAWADQGQGDLGDIILWISCVAFCQACALRLARFNISPGKG
ncbi:CDP-diacylglycerol--serine O-phosphatidyltransferase [Symbiodinium microadriaticum]|uniref:CDP-diacylglycerol--serine O-phosphatidyltransferase n=1 Tax=Symbiodinium microadriaticum TaxID=2951 RepID=A0A1Q9DW72_SYMMI|nr:CDP-diacylglycerol--serine O-phosphatidyltransferase [Symbiodinium microadriaticum]